MRGRRAASTRPASSAATAAPANITLGPTKKSVVLPDGEVEGTITGARAVTGKTSGATSLVLTLETDEGDLVNLQPMLIASKGGPSTLTDNNVAVSRDMAAVPEDQPIGLAALVERLTGARVWVDLSEQTDRDGRPINRIEDGGPLGDDE
jgi:hypothetical protein